MGAKYIQEGKNVDYTPGSAVTAGDVVVQGDLVGVAKLDIAANRQGALAVEAEVGQSYRAVHQHRQA